MKINPICRYGHGELSVQPGKWALTGIEFETFDTSSTVNEPLSTIALNGNAFTLSIYRCPTCGYLEFFDDDAHYEYQKNH